MLPYNSACEETHIIMLLPLHAGHVFRPNTAEQTSQAVS